MIECPAAEAGTVVTEAGGVTEELAVSVGVDGAPVAACRVVGEGCIREGNGGSAACVNCAPYKAAQHSTRRYRYWQILIIALEDTQYWFIS